MAERCLTLGCPEVVRIAKQDSCSGEATPGEGNGYALSCIRNWSIEPIVREGETSEFTSDCGSVVIRDKQDDQLMGYTISFETSQRSNELEALVTGKELIASGGNNIGTYGLASSLGCTSPSEDPRFVIEAFYKLSKCVTGANHVRLVLPMAQFKVTELDREGTITFYRYTAETGIALASALAVGGGPFADFPAGVVTFLESRDEDEYTTGFDFEENISISGSCGAIEVPSLVPFEILALASNDPEDGFTITGTDLTAVDSIGIDFYDQAAGGVQTGGLTIYNPANPGNAALNAAAGTVVTTWNDTTIDIYNVTAPYDGLNGDFVRVVYASDLGVTYTQTFNVVPGELWVSTP